MRKRSVLLVCLGLTACVCWAIGSAVAEQPGTRAVSTPQSQAFSGVNTKSPAAQTAEKPVVSPTQKERTDTQAPATVHLGTETPQGKTTPQNQRPAGLKSPVLGKDRILSSSRLQPIPANPERHTFVVDATGQQGAMPRDEGGVCLPASGNCGPVVYRNLDSEYFNYADGSAVDGVPLLDDVWLAGAERDICSLTVQSYGFDGTYSVAVEFWTDCPANTGATKLAGPYTSGVLPSGLSNTTFALPGIHVPTNFYIQSVYTPVTATSAGPTITELAEIGFTDDWIYLFDTATACSQVWYGGGPTVNPWSGYGYALSAATAQVGKCCFNNCTQCVEVSYGECLQRPGNPEFQLGATCAELPNCGKGACCLTDGTCVANKTLAECQALPNYQPNSWQVGTDCTAHGVVEAVDCAPVPANDLCANAVSLSGTCITVAYNNRNATYTAYTGDTVSCLRDPADPNNDVPITNDVWYFYQIPSTYNGYAVTEAKVLINTLGSKYDTVVAAYAKNWGTAPAPACGESGAITCADADVVNGNIVGCNDDIVGIPVSSYDPLHEQIQASYITVSCDGTNGPLPGGCLLIRVGGLLQSSNNPGGPGVLNIDFIPTSPDPFYGSNGICCLSTGGCVLTNTAGECADQGGYYRATTDFYENGNPPAGFETKAPGCCHGEFGSCQEGEYCGKPIVMVGNAWTGDVYKVTYFKFTTRDFRDGDPGYPGTDPHYALTIDTCGSGFDTVLTVYKGPFSSSPFTESGDCDDPGAVVARNDNCTLDSPGAEGRVTCANLNATTSCVCLTVGSDETNYNLMAGNEYYIAVGKKDARTTPQRAMGIDPVPNYPIADAVPLTVTLNDSWANCSACAKQCCKGDMDGNGVLNGKDIQGFVSVLCGSALSCQDVTWCRANMNGDSVVSVADIAPFVNALLVPWVCDNTNYCGVDGYCQAPDQSGGIISDMNQNFKVADNFVSLTGGQLNRICWWGINAFRSGTTWGACTITIPPDNFAIRLYTNVDNRPGEVIASYSGITAGAAPYNLTKTATGNTIVGANEYKYEVQIPPVSVEAGDCLWLEIVNNTGTGNCWWLWETTYTSGDGLAAQYEYGYYRTLTDTSAAFCLNIPIRAESCVQYCTLQCPAGSIAEGEPDCGAGYVDSYNAGCNMAPGTEQFTTIQCGQTICGKSGIYDSATPGYIERDTDWYKLVLTGTVEQQVTLTVNAEFTVVAGFLEYAQNVGSGNCADLSGYISPLVVGRCTSLTTDAWLNPGTYYIFVAPSFNDPFYPDCGAKYTLNVTCVPCSTYTNCLTTAAQPEKCPGGTGHTAETETCGASTNDGCNMTPAAFASIACGGKVCGTAWGSGGTRDTDWYQFTVTQRRLVKATLKSEFPGIVMLLKINNCSTFDIDVLATAYSSACSSATAAYELDAGTYIAFVAPGDANGGIFSCVNCNMTWTDYDLHLTCDAPITCTGTTLYCQDYRDAPMIVNANLAGTTQYKVADNFRPTAAGSISHVCFWAAGGYNAGTGFAPCTIGTTNFQIAFHNDASGLPATTPTGTRTLGNLTGTYTGTNWGNYPIYMFETNFTPFPVTAGNKYWISIWNTTNATTCWVMAVVNPDGAGGDDVGAQWNGTAWTRVWYDIAFCVNVAGYTNVFGNMPANDTCSGAVTLTIPSSTTTQDLSWATGGDLPPLTTCGITAAPSGIPPKSVWYKFTAPASGNVTIDVCSSTTGLLDTMIGLFSGTCASLTELNCQDDGCTAGTPYWSKLVKTGLTPGQVYYVEIGLNYYYTHTPGTIKVSITTP